MSEDAITKSEITWRHDEVVCKDCKRPWRRTSMLINQRLTEPLREICTACNHLREARRYQTRASKEIRFALKSAEAQGRELIFFRNKEKNEAKP